MARPKKHTDEGAAEATAEVTVPVAEVVETVDSPVVEVTEPAVELPSAVEPANTVAAIPTPNVKDAKPVVKRVTKVVM